MNPISAICDMRGLKDSGGCRPRLSAMSQSMSSAADGQGVTAKTSLKDEHAVRNAETLWNVAYSFEFQIKAKRGSLRVDINGPGESKAGLLKDNYS